VISRSLTNPVITPALALQLSVTLIGIGILIFACSAISQSLHR